MSKSCYYQAVNGVSSSCEEKCENCEWYLDEPEWPKDKTEQDELPNIREIRNNDKLNKIIEGLEYSWKYIKERPNPTATPKAIAMHNILNAIEFLKDRDKNFINKSESESSDD